MGITAAPASADTLYATRVPRSLLGRSTDARLRYFQRYLIGHHQLERAREKILRALFLPRDEDTWTPVILVMGPAGVGKTTLLRAVERDIAHRLKRALTRDPERLASAHCELEVGDGVRFSWKHYCQRALQALEEPMRDYKIMPLGVSSATLGASTYAAARTDSTVRMSEWTLREAAICAALRRRPAAFLIDEGQQTATSAGGRTLLNQMDYVKRLADTMRVPHVLFGHYGLTPLRQVSGQLARRTVDVHFRRYLATRPDDLAEFRNVVLSFQCYLPVASPPPLIEWWEDLYVRSVGCVGLLKTWLMSALDEALKRGEQTIAQDVLWRNAPPPSKSKKILAEAQQGEEELAELEDAEQIEAGVRELRNLVGLPAHDTDMEQVPESQEPPDAPSPGPLSLQTHGTIDTSSPAESGSHARTEDEPITEQATPQGRQRPRRRGRWQPGERRPTRDPVPPTNAGPDKQGIERANLAASAAERPTSEAQGEAER
jgi:hypothetical protein